MEFIVVAYFTDDDIYRPAAERLIASLTKFNIPQDVQQVDDTGSWYGNTGYKPTFLQKMDKKYPDKAIVYVDADAEFQSYPMLFLEYLSNREVKVAVHLFDCERNYGIAHQGHYEILSGTVYLKDCIDRAGILRSWASECKKAPLVWDQIHLGSVLAVCGYTKLPPEYCKIFDRQKWVTAPVIVHYQASRQVKNKFDSSGGKGFNIRQASTVSRRRQRMHRQSYSEGNGENSKRPMHS